MNELDELIRQKKEIELKIKELKKCASVVGQVKIDVEHYPTNKPDRHFLAVFYKPLEKESRSKWMPIFVANDKQSIVDAIPGIIANLQELYAQNKEEI